MTDLPAIISLDNLNSETGGDISNASSIINPKIVPISNETFPIVPPNSTQVPLTPFIPPSPPYVPSYLYRQGV